MFSILSLSKFLESKLGEESAKMIVQQAEDLSKDTHVGLIARNDLSKVINSELVDEFLKSHPLPSGKKLENLGPSYATSRTALFC
jgi:hypothetical protein